MERSVYEAIVRSLAVPLSAVPWFSALAQRFSVSESTMYSIYAQEVHTRVIRAHNALKAAAAEHLQRWLAGRELLELCWDLDLPPCIVLRRLLELPPLALQRDKLTRLLRQPELTPTLLPLELLVHHAAALHLQPQLTPAAAPSTCTTTSSSAVLDPLPPAAAAASPTLLAAAAAFQARVQAEVEAAVACDRVYSPASDASRRAAGLEHEQRLNEALDAAGIAYWSEDQLRLQGYHKTPDARLRVPVAVRGRIVNWIDSKATFGDEKTHRQQTAEQYERYVNRFGPGLVIYWHGYLADLAAGDEAVLLLDDFPPPQDIFRLPCLPLSLAAGLPELPGGGGAEQQVQQQSSGCAELGGRAAEGTPVRAAPLATAAVSLGVV